MSSTERELKKALDKVELTCRSVLREDNFREVLQEILKLEYQSEVSFNQKRTVTDVKIERHKNGEWVLMDCRDKLNVVAGSFLQLTDSRRPLIVDPQARVGSVTSNHVIISHPATTQLPGLVDVCVLPNVKDYERYAKVVSRVEFFLGKNFCQTAGCWSVQISPNEKLCDYNGRPLSNEQRTAVQRILRSPSQVMLLEGPPGTGKSTIIEALVRFLLNHAKRMLIVAPSNEAADRLAEIIATGSKLTNKQQILRPQAKHRQRDKVSDLVLRFSVDEGVTQNGSKFPFRHVTAREFNTARVVITTLSTAAACFERVFNFDESKAFDLVVVDEAAQCTEVDVLCAMAYAKKGITRLVLAGDSQQLGPTVRTQELKDGAIRYDRSPMERLLQSTWANPKLSVVRLTETHRFHPALFSCVNALYKGVLRLVKKTGNLQPDVTENRLCCLHVAGNVCTDGCSRNNIDEVMAVKSLLHSGRIAQDLLSKTVVLTPYKSQARLLRKHFDQGSRLLMNVKTSTVDAFQGQEAEVVIVSTVLPYSSKDSQTIFGGFAGFHKRVNTAVSRARSYLFVVGDMMLLQRDPMWSLVLSHCTQIDNNNNNNNTAKTTGMHSKQSNISQHRHIALTKSMDSATGVPHVAGLSLTERKRGICLQVAREWLGLFT